MKHYIWIKFDENIKRKPTFGGNFLKMAENSRLFFGHQSLWAKIENILDLS